MSKKAKVEWLSEPKENPPAEVAEENVGTAESPPAELANGETEKKQRKPRDPNAERPSYLIVGIGAGGAQRDCLMTMPTLGRARKWMEQNAVAFSRFYQEIKLYRVKEVK